MTQVWSSSSPHSEPLPQEIQIFRGNTWSFTAEVRSASSGEIVDLTGYTGWFAVKARDSYSDTNILIWKRTDVAGEGSIVAPTTGRMLFTMLAADTSALAPGVYFWDFGIFDVDEKITCARGQLELKLGVLHGVPAA